MSLNIWPKFICVYLIVPFNKKDIAKQYGCRWSSDKKMWFKQFGLEGINISEMDGMNDIINSFHDELFQFEYSFCNLSSEYFNERELNILLAKEYKLMQNKYKNGELKKQRETELLERIQNDNEKFKQREIKRAKMLEKQKKIDAELDIEIDELLKVYEPDPKWFNTKKNHMFERWGNSREHIKRDLIKIIEARKGEAPLLRITSGKGEAPLLRITSGNAPIIKKYANINFDSDSD